MKLAPIAERGPRFPHVVTRGERMARRWQVAFANRHRALGPDDVYAVFGAGFASPAGELTDRGRGKLIEKVAAEAHGSGLSYCIVWGEHECTYVGADGATRDGTRPPKGQLVVSDAVPIDEPLIVENVSYVTLPPGCLASHLCIRQTGRYVEIVEGAPMVLADFREALSCGDNPTSALKDQNGVWRSGLHHRGVRVESIVEDAILLGPIQPVPGGNGMVLVEPWPDHVAEVCQDLAGRALSQTLLDAAWEAIDPKQHDVMRVGVLKAA